MQLVTAPNRPEMESQIPATTAASISVGSTDEKPKFLKTVAQGLGNFFKTIKDWFKSDSKTESFKDLGRRFSSWFRNIKEKILQSKREQEPLPGVISVDPLPRGVGTGVAATGQITHINAASSAAQPETEVKKPAIPVLPVEEQTNALVHVKPTEPVELAEPVKSSEHAESDAPVLQANIGISRAEIGGAVSRGPESAAPAPTLALVSPKISTPKVFSPEVVSPKAPTPKMPTPEVPKGEVYSPKAPTPKMPTPEVPKAEVYSPKAPTPKLPTPEVPKAEAYSPKVPTPKIPTPEVPKAEVYSPEAPTPGAASLEAPTPEVVSLEAPTPDVASSKIPTPKAASKEGTPKVRTPKVPTSEAVAPKAPIPDATPKETASGVLTPQLDTIDHGTIRMPVQPLDQAEPPYQPMAETELATQETTDKGREQDAAERLAANLDSEYEGSFDDDEAQDALRPAMGSLVDVDYERLRKLPSGYRSPFNSEYESGPPRGLIGTFSKKAGKELRELEAEGYRDYPTPHFDEGVRKNPSHLDPMDNLFLEQGLDPLKIDLKDRRNYAIILEWYKQTRAPQDRGHPKHRELYFADPNPPPDENGRRYLWGTDTYMEQKSHPAPVPYIREKMKEAGTLEKIGEMLTFGLISNDPNRPHFWFHDWLPGFSRENEIEDWINLNIPADWIKGNFPTEVGPVSRKKYEGLTPLERKARLTAYNNRYKDAADRKNKKNANILHRMGQADACAQAVRAGKSQAAASLAFPCAEEILKNRTLWDQLKARLFGRQTRYNLLKQERNMRNIDREDLHMRLEADGVLVIDEP